MTPRMTNKPATNARPAPKPTPRSASRGTTGSCQHSRYEERHVQARAISFPDLVPSRHEPRQRLEIRTHRGLQLAGEFLGDRELSGLKFLDHCQVARDRCPNARLPTVLHRGAQQRAQRGHQGCGCSAIAPTSTTALRRVPLVSTDRMNYTAGSFQIDHSGPDVRGHGKVPTGGQV
jgi:hypothetical protein